MRLLPIFNDEYDCRKCGACCSSYWNYTKDDIHISIKESDRARFTPKQIDWLLKPETLNVLTKSNSDCIAHRGTVGKESACAIYEVRPDTCREFEAGSEACKAVRAFHQARLWGELKHV